MKNFIDFIDLLPHGSGIDATWTMNQSQNTVFFMSSYHVMDNGFYIGWQDFTVKIPKGLLVDWQENGTLEKIAVEFWLSFETGSLHRYYDLRDYLEDTIAESIRGGIMK